MKFEMMDRPRTVSTVGGGGAEPLLQCSSCRSCSFSLTPARLARGSRAAEPELDDGKRRRQPTRASVRRTLSTRIDKPTSRDSAALGAGRAVFRSEAAPFGASRRLAKNSTRLVICLAAFALFGAGVLEAKPAENPAGLIIGPANSSQLGLVDLKPHDQSVSKSNKTLKSISIESLTDLIDQVTSALTTSKSTEPTTATTTSIETTPTPTTRGSEEAQSNSSANQTDSNKATEATATTTTTAATTTTTTTSDEDENDSPGAGDDDLDAEDCQGLSSGAAAPGAGPSDNERLVNLQTCLQKKVQRRLKESTRSSMELFEKLSLSGSCSASLMNLMTSLGQLKGFAFKFIDASAKIPSGMMSGLLSDFGDFEQCLAIRSNPAVDPQLEQEEGGYSGKYCMLNIRMRYHVKLGPNSSAPEGIYPDGLLWDELVRNYWTTNSSKGFQVGICVPSRCSQDDLEQMFQLFAESYHFSGQIGACQDTNDVRRQQQPDALQWAILSVFLGLLLLNLIGTIVDLCLLEPNEQNTNWQVATCSPLQLVTCFSLRCNWLVLLHRHRTPLAVLGKFSHPHQTLATCNRSTANNKERRPLVSSDFGNSSNGSCLSTSTSNILTASSLFCSSTPEGAINYSNISSQDSRYQRQPPPLFQPLTIRTVEVDEKTNATAPPPPAESGPDLLHATEDPLSHLNGLKLMVIIWVTIGHSFLYPSANNYQHYRSIINMAITRKSVWFAITNFILGIDMLLYMTGLLFVYRLATGRPGASLNKQSDQQQPPSISARIGRLILRKVLRLWPVYLSVIALAIVAPLVSNGPMWPQVMTIQLGETCRQNWWANLLMINNFLEPSRVCLPSSWFISVVIQCFLVGSLVMMVANWHSMRAAAAFASLSIFASSTAVFWQALSNKLNAPAIRMDESFVLDLDDNIFQMYSSTLSNLGPFLVGMLGGFVLLWHQTTTSRMEADDSEDERTGEKSPKIELISSLMFELNMAFAMLLIALVVLSSVFFSNYTPFWSAIYWSCHRVSWAIVTGYLIHQCATNKWRLLKQLLSLDNFVPLARLIFLAYLTHPIFIHLHSGLVRDGLHVSLYNMLNIYISRLVMTFGLALALHLLVELPVCNLEERLIESWLDRRRLRNRRKNWLESGGHRSPNSKAHYTTAPNASDGPKLNDKPLLAIATKRPPPFAKGATDSLATFARQHTTESTLSNSSD